MLSFSIFTVPLIIGYLLDLIFGDPLEISSGGVNVTLTKVVTRNETGA